AVATGATTAGLDFVFAPWANVSVDLHADQGSLPYQPSAYAQAADRWGTIYYVAFYAPSVTGGIVTQAAPQGPFALYSFSGFQHYATPGTVISTIGAAGASFDATWTLLGTVAGSLHDTTGAVVVPPCTYCTGKQVVLTGADPGAVVSTWVFLDPAATPKELMLQFYANGWEHRAYWGDNLLP